MLYLQEYWDTQALYLLSRLSQAKITDIGIINKMEIKPKAMKHPETKQVVTKQVVTRQVATGQVVIKHMKIIHTLQKRPD